MRLVRVRAISCAQVTALAAMHNRAQKPQSFHARDAENYLLALGR